MKVLPLSPVDPDSPVPLYYQVELDLRRLIESGRLAPGEPVPPEMDLCRRYQVSRQTMRMALSRLVADALIARSPGRGTFVTPPAARTKFYLDRSFTQQMAELGRTAHSRLLAAAPGTVDAHDAEALQPYRGAACLRLARLRLGDDEPVGIQHTTILTEACPGLEAHDFETESLYDVLARVYELVIREIRHTVTAAVAGPEETELLGVGEGAPLLVVHTTALLAGDRIIEYTTSFYRADRYEYSTRHTL